MSKFKKYKSSVNPTNYQSGGFNMDFLKNVAGRWKDYMKDPFSSNSETYINDLLDRNKSSLTQRGDLQKQLIISDRDFTDWDTADAAYTKIEWDKNYASKFGKKWDELSPEVQEGIYKKNKFIKKGWFNDVDLGGDIGDQSKRMFDQDRATREKLSNVNKNFNNQLLETGAGIFSLMDAQKEYDNKPQEKFALDFTDDKGILRSQKGGSIPTSHLGLLEHPNKVVRVPGNNITMKDINSPVIAYPNNDKPELMLPGYDYKFPNSTNVIEVPLSEQNLISNNTNNTHSMSKFAKKIKAFQSGNPTYQGVSPLVLPVAPIMSMGVAPKANKLNENVAPIYGTSLVDQYKKELEDKQNSGFDYYRHYVTKGNNEEAFGAILGKFVKGRKEKKELEKLQKQQDELDKQAEQKATMQSALNKGLNAYRDKEKDIIAANYRDKNGNMQQVPVGTANNPTTQNMVQRLDNNGTIPGTDVTPANTIADKANSQNGSTSSQSSSSSDVYSLPGDKNWEYAKDSNGDWITRKRNGRDGAYISLIDNQKAIDKLNREAVSGNLYPDVTSKKSSSTPYSSKPSTSKFKSYSNSTKSNTDDAPTEGAMVRKGDSYYIVGKDGKLIEEKFDDSSNTTTPNKIDLLKNRPIGVYSGENGDEYSSNLSLPGPRFGKPRGTWSEAEKNFEKDLLIGGASLLPLGRLAGTGVKASQAAAKKAIQVGGNIVSKEGKILGKAKDLLTKTKETFKVGEKPNGWNQILEGRVNSAGRAIDPATKRFVTAPKDTRGTLQRVLQDTNLSGTFKSTINNIVSTGKRLSDKAYKALSQKEKITYDELISQMMSKKQSGGATFSKQDLFNHYYKSL